MKINERNHPGFHLIKNENDYYRLIDYDYRRDSFSQIKAHDRISGEVIIYTEKDDNFLIINGDKTIFLKLGKYLKRGMTAHEVFQEGMKRKIIHPRVNVKIVNWNDLDENNTQTDCFYYLKNF